MVTHFISDLHLADDRPGISAILLRYLDGQAREAERLYLLGDVFEYWLGDDISQPRYTEVCDALAAVAAAGVAVFFMRGNRDFMVGDAFAASTGCTLLDDPHCIDIDGRRALLSHGDLLCTDDVEHQKFRAMVSQPEVRNRLLGLPAEQREMLAQQLRGMSKSGNSLKSADIMDVNQQTVENLMREHDTALLIHGHTHRCARHEFMLDGKAVQRIVLSDWHETEGSVLVADQDSLRFEKLS